MKLHKILFWVFTISAVLLSDVMCAVVASQYTKLVFGAQYAGYSAPPQTAFLYIIPFAVGIAACGILAWVFYRKSK